MTTVHQLLSYARAGDAVTQQALDLRPRLAGVGESQLLAAVPDGSVATEVAALDAAAVNVPVDDLVLYHVTIGCEPAVRWLRERSGPYGLVHHNITPHRFFEGFSWEHARLAEQGRQELAALAPGARVVVADSSFNAAEIEALGGTVAVVHPPIRTTRRLASIPDDPATVPDLGPAPALVHIGQRLPHKRSHQLVAAVHLLRQHLGVDATLTLVGARPVPSYARVIDELLADLLPGAATDTGLVPDAAVATHLRHARALVTTSAHEGFCVPVVEAMAMGVPVVACDAGAVAETAGGAALLLPADASLPLLAEALHAVVTDDALAADLSARGRRRAEELEESIDLGHVAELVRAAAR